MSENNQHTGPKQDTGENVAISSAAITKIKNKGTRRGRKNSESGSDGRELDAKCNSKEVKEIVRQEMDALHTCRPNDDESRNKDSVKKTTQNSGNVVEETVREINERKLGKQISLYLMPRNQKQT